MGTTVNFEDLFDFSPEPVDPDQGDYAEEQEYNQHHQQQQQQQHQDVDFQRLNLLKTPPSHSPSGYHERASLSSSPRNTCQLSASLPVGHASNLSASYTGSSSPGSLMGDSFGHQGEEIYGSVPGISVGPETKGKRGRKPGQKTNRPDVQTNKLERSRQSARECRARKKLRYQYLDDMILERERANIVLRNELLLYQAWCHELDKGKIPDGLNDFLKQIKTSKEDQNQNQFQ